MAQVVKLKRTAVSGKIPSISNLELGELAINTYDGRIFFEKDSGTPVVSEILTTNTENYITGSLKLNGAVTASYFKGDGSQLTNVSATISENATVTGSFLNASSFTVNHAFETKNIIVSVYDTNDSQIIPQSITLTDNNNVQITLSSAQSGFAVVAKGGHIVSGSAGDASNLNGQPASYYLDYGNLNNIPSGIISGSSQLANTSISNESLNSFTQSAITVSGNGVSGSVSVFSDTHTVVNSPITSLDSGTTLTHSNNGNIIFTVSGSNGELFTVTDSNSGNLLEVNDTSGIDVFTVSAVGDVSASGAITASGITGLTSLTIDGNIYGTSFNGTGLVSGSSQITDLTTYKETVSGASSYVVDHNLSEQYPIVQAWNTATSQQELPNSITTNSTNRVTVDFSTTFAGIIIVKK